jgi:hypothetical protein
MKYLTFFVVLLLSIGCGTKKENKKDGTELFTHDFEEGDLRGWTTTGEAFKYQPTLGDNPSARHRGQPSHHQGKYWIGTYEKYQGHEGEKAGAIQSDGPQGAMTSAEFVIDMKRISLLVGGAANPQTLVELIVNGKSVFQAHGQDNESMERVVWDISAHRGQKARIRAVDGSSTGWAHINFDDIIFEY